MWSSEYNGAFSLSRCLPGQYILHISPPYNAAAPPFCAQGSLDDLKSPSARLCVGRVVEVGTGAVELIHNL